MEVELADVHLPPEKALPTSDQPRFAKDEAVLARFGKRQQLRVSACPNIHCISFANFGITEGVWTVTSHRAYQHLDDNLGGDHVVSHILVPLYPIDHELRGAYTEPY